MTTTATTSVAMSGNAGLERGLILDSMLMKQATEPPFSPSPPKAIPVTSEYHSETEAAVQSLDNADILQLKPASVNHNT